MKKTFIGEVIVTENLFIKSADYAFLKFTGIDMNASIADVITPEDLPLFKNVHERLLKDDVAAVLGVRNNKGEYFPFFAELHAISNAEWDQILIKITFTDLRCLLDNERILKHTRKLTAAYFDVLSAVLIAYKRDIDEIEVYYINDARRYNILSGTFDKCKKEMEPRILPESIKEFEDFCKNLKKSSKSFSAALKIDEIYGLKGVNCNIRCKCVGSDVVGCVDIENAEEFKDNRVDIINDKDAFLDMLNKRAIVEQAERIIASTSKRNYFILLDLDNFKIVNDAYGHIVGDEVLIKVTQIINDNIAGRGYVGRMGGDEILIITENIDNQTELRNMLRSIRTNIEWTFKNDPRSLNVTCSMGVNTFPDYGKDFQSLYSVCDKMLYLAKEKGKNRYIIYTPELHDSIIYASNSEQTESAAATKDLAGDKVGIMQRLVDNYLIRHSYNNEKIFSEIGEAFNLNEILMIYENFTVAFQWTPSGVFSDIGKISYFKPEKDFDELFNKDNLLVLDGLYKLEGRCPEVEKCLENKGVKSAIFYRINRGNKFSGYVMFARAYQRQSWSEYEIMALSTAAKVFDVSMHD